MGGGSAAAEWRELAVVVLGFSSLSKNLSGEESGVESGDERAEGLSSSSNKTPAAMDLSFGGCGSVVDDDKGEEVELVLLDLRSACNL